MSIMKSAVISEKEIENSNHIFLKTISNKQEYFETSNYVNSSPLSLLEKRVMSKIVVGDADLKNSKDFAFLND